MKTLHKRGAGLDVHKEVVVACLRVVIKSKVCHEVRRFAKPLEYDPARVLRFSISPV